MARIYYDSKPKLDYITAMSTESLRHDGEPTVTATLAAAGEDAQYEVSPRYGSVHLKALSMEAQQVLSQFDRNGDGEVDESELENVIDVLVKEQFKGRMFLCGILMLTFSLILLLSSSFGLTWAVVLAHKDMTVKNGVLVVPGTNDPVEIANMDYTLSKQGALSSRRNDTSVLSTAPSYVYRVLDTNMTMQQLSSLFRVTINGLYGNQVGFRVTGFSLHSQRSPPELHITTPTGTLVVQGAQLAGYEAASGLVDPEVLKGQSVTGTFKK